MLAELLEYSAHNGLGGAFTLTRRCSYNVLIKQQQCTNLADNSLDGKNALHFHSSSRNAAGIMFVTKPLLSAKTLQLLLSTRTEPAEDNPQLETITSCLMERVELLFDHFGR